MVLRVRVVLLVNLLRRVVVDSVEGYGEVAGEVGCVEPVSVDGDVGYTGLVVG